MTLPEQLSKLSEIGMMGRGLVIGLRQVQNALRDEGIELPETLKRTIHRLDMDLDDFALDLQQMTER